MGTYPWGPHGPQSGPIQVTPNPTPAYVPPAPTPSWNPAPSAPSYGGGGGTGSVGGGYVGYSGPKGKSYLLALILSTLFGPLGLLYSSKMMGVLGLVTFSFLIYLQVAHAPAGMINASGGFMNFMANNAVLDHAWSLFVFWSVVFAIIGVFRYNRAIKKKKD